MDKVEANVSKASSDMQALATVLQSTFGGVGDVKAADLMQAAKVFAGDLKDAAQAAAGTSGEVAPLLDKKAMLDGVDLQDVGKATQAEDAIAQMERLTATMETKTEELQALAVEALPPASNGELMKQYYPVMYFVDSSKDKVPSTCGGTV